MSQGQVPDETSEWNDLTFDIEESINPQQQKLDFAVFEFTLQHIIIPTIIDVQANDLKLKVGGTIPVINGMVQNTIQWVT